jgi:LmbE family N-acetylglucosaminyl deacetylase
MPHRLLFVLAHPDDETFGAGGTIALSARRGVEVHLICATRGEVGEAPSDLRGYASVGEMRVAELQCAANVLGVRAIHFLNYRDSGMRGSPDNTHPDALAAQPTEWVARAIARHIREIRPQVIVTFDPIGGYMHPDHIATHNATMRAFALAGDAAETPGDLLPYAPQKLYWMCFPRREMRLVVRLLRLLGRDPRKFGKNGDIDLVAIAEAEYPVHARIAIGAVAEAKAEATACHASQTGSLGAVERRLMRLLSREELYSRAVPADAPAKVERDLFEGVELGD